MHPPARSEGTSRHQPELDGIRGLAILFVLLSHAPISLGVLPRFTPHNKWVSLISYVLVPGWGGVDLFFALSGFLITGILLRARTSPIYFSSFYARRTLRIFPIYYLFLTFSLIGGHLWPAFNAELPAAANERVSYFLYIQNWPVFWTSWAGMTSLWGAFWSLAVEEQFYLMWPTLIRLFSVPVMLGLCIVGFVLGWPLRWLVIHYLTGMTVGCLQFPLSRLDGLFLGAACALYREYSGRPIPLKWAKLSFCAGAALLLQISVLHVRELYGVGVHIVTYGVTGFALMGGGLIAASQHQPSPLHRVLTWRPLLIAGRYSYGMYVYHLLIYLALAQGARSISPSTGGELNVFAALLCIAFAILVVTGVAALSFYVLEQPLLRLKRFFPSPSAPVPSSYLEPIHPA